MTRHGSCAHGPRRTLRPIATILATAFAAALLAGLALPCLAADALPDGPAVLAKYAQAVGGVAAWDSLKNMVTQGVYGAMGSNSQLGYTEYRARPNKLYVVLDSPQGKFMSGAGGEDAWEYSVQQGSRLLEAQELADKLRDAVFGGLVYFRSAYRTPETVGVDTVSGRPCYKVTMRPKLGSPETMYFDVENGLLVMIDGTYESTERGPFNAKTYPSDWRKVGSVLVPYKTATDALGQRLVLTVTEAQVNADLPDDRFDPPSEVKGLLEARKKQ